MGLNLSILEGTYCVHRLSPDSHIPADVFNSPFYTISRTPEELSIVCPSAVLVGSEQKECGWCCIKISGPLDFSLTGILAKISTVLADAGISIFALSTFDTDYLLVKSEKIKAAAAVLQNSGYTVIGRVHAG